MEAVAILEYSAQAADELSLKIGDVIQDVVKTSSGWCEGSLNGKTGAFPDNVVRMTKEEVVLRDKPFTARQRCRAAYSYSPKHEDELLLAEGDIIEVLGVIEEGWWRGKLNGKIGAFPSNFVTDVVPADNSPTLPPRPDKVFCQVKFDYTAQNDDELTLRVGDVLTLISTDVSDPGWWKGELRGQIGLFPDNFVGVVPSKESAVAAAAAAATAAVASSPAASAEAKPSEKAGGKVADEPKQSQRRSLEQPVPKKPSVPVKKSPSTASNSGGIISSLKKKISDAVDGGAASKMYVNVEPKPDAPAGAFKPSDVDDFDQVERNPMLADPRANRTKGPGRRPPTALFKDHDPVPNGTSDGPDPPSDDDAEIKPKAWEKQKAPWMDELKLNQAKRSNPLPPAVEPPKTPDPVKLAKTPEPAKLPEVEAKPAPAKKPVSYVAPEAKARSGQKSPIDVEDDFVRRLASVEAQLKHLATRQEHLQKEMDEVNRLREQLQDEVKRLAHCITQV